MSEVQLGTLYDMNKELMKNEKCLSKTKLREVKQKLSQFFAEDEYFMLLCHDLHDYTVFRQNEPFLKAAEESAKILIDECLFNRGEVLSIELTEDKLAYEIWIRNEEGIFCYYLFPYTQAVIEVTP